MCKIGDIILIDKYKSHDKDISRHSFVVIDDDGGEVSSLPYDFVCNVLSSFKSETQKQRKLSYPGNFPIRHTDVNIPDGNKNSGYIKTDQLYYFNKNKISYKVIGSMNIESFNKLIDFIMNSDFDLEHISDNL